MTTTREWWRIGATHRPTAHGEKGAWSDLNRMGLSGIQARAIVQSHTQQPQRLLPLARALASSSQLTWDWREAPVVLTVVQ